MIRSKKTIDTKKFDDSIASTIEKMTLEQKVSLIHASQKFESGSVEDLGISSLVVSDGPHGVRPELIPDIIAFEQAGRDDDYSVYLPTEIALASTWNVDLSYDFGHTLAVEARTRGKEVLLGPGINIIRTPVNGRNFEYLSEDPFLTKSMAVPYIHGVQDQGVAACAKHLVANNQEWQRFSISAEMDDRTLNEIYLPAFKAAVQQGQVLTIMGAYNKFRGQFCCENQYILNDILKTKWEFDGLVMSDWNATHNTIDATTNGLDLEMGTEKEWDDYYLANPLMKAIREGNALESYVDDKVKRVLRVMKFVREFDHSDSTQMDIQKHDKLALKVARESIVLLKNDGGLLPLKPDNVGTVAVIGINAIRKHAIEGGSSQVKARYEITPLEGIKNHFSDSHIIYAEGYSDENNEPSTASQLKSEALDAASKADTVIFVGGLNHIGHDREYFDRESMLLPYAQDELISEIVKVNPKTVVALVSGTPNDMTNWINDVPVVIQAWYNGMEGGNALAEILLGKTNPSGKLTVTFPKTLTDSAAHASPDTYPGQNGKVVYKEGIYVGYRYNDKENIEPQFCFGHGMSYSTFEYSRIETSSSQLTKIDNEVVIDFTVANLSQAAGSETAQVYISPNSPNVSKAIKELKGFSKVHIQSMDSEKFSVTLNRDDFLHFCENEMDWKLDSGSYDILVGSSSSSIHLSTTIEVS